MGKRRNSKKQVNGILSIVIFAILVIVGIIGEKYFSNNNEIQNEEKNIIAANIENTIEKNEEKSNIIENEQVENNGTIIAGENIKVYYFDVGQADSILVTSNDEAMLIDAGNNADGNLVVNNIKALGITKLKYVVGTHPHEDHIGGLDNVIKEFEIENIFMPKIQTTTKTFEDVLDAISAKGLKITSPEQGYTFKVGGINCEIMLCGSGTEKEQKSNLNLSSIVIRAVYGENSFLFTGDAETENEVTRKWPETTILKVGHHGSDTSSSEEFLNQVKPQTAIISVGTGNKYGHPKSITLNNLNKLGTKIYRTDESGNITITSNGTQYTVNTEK